MKTHIKIAILVVLLFSVFALPALAEDSSPTKHWYQITFKTGNTTRDVSGSSSLPMEKLLNGDRVIVLEDITYVATNGSAQRAPDVAKMLFKADTVISVQEWTRDPLTIHPSTRKNGK